MLFAPNNCAYAASLVSEDYTHAPSDFFKGGLLAAWLVLCDLGLKSIARVGGCSNGDRIGLDLLAHIFAVPETCTGSPLMGTAIRLVPTVHDGALLGLGAGFFGDLAGQIYGLGALALATMLSILVLQWRRHTSGDVKALAVLWAGASLTAAPRLLGDGRGLAELEGFGLNAGIGDLALLWSLAWLLARGIGELRA